MSNDDDRSHEGESREPGDSDDDQLTRELKRIDAESEAVEIDFDAEVVEIEVDSEEDDGPIGVREGDDDDSASLIWAVPGLTRMAVKAWARTVVWGAQTSVRVSLRLGHAAVDPRATVSLVRDVSSGVRLYAREFLGITDLERRVEHTDPGRGGGPSGPGAGLALMRRPPREEKPPPPEVTLRRRGAELLRESADVSTDDRMHPAYSRIISELAPDEGRILRLLASEGPQPTVDVRALNLIGIGSQLVAKEMSMVGPEAGCQHLDRMPDYLINLQRLGLVEFSEEAIADPSRYQVVEAQPDVLGVIKETNRAKTEHRSLRLTSFGQRFCDVCLPLDIDEVEDLTEGSS